MPEEERQEANLALLAACHRLTPQQWYNAKFLCMSQFMAERGVTTTKSENVKNPLDMSIEDFMSVSSCQLDFLNKLPLHYLFLIEYCIFQVVPEWADEHLDAFEELVKRWKGENADFKALGDRNKKNRGKGGTHNVGNRSHGRVMEKLVYTSNDLHLIPVMSYLTRITYLFASAGGR